VETRKRLLLAIAQLAELYGKGLSESALLAYADALDDLEPEALAAALDAARRTCRWFPMPAELRALAGAGQPDAGLVNALISRHVGTPGGDRTAPADPFLRLVLERLGGVRRASDMTAPDRLRLLERVLPAVLTACRVRGVPVPTEQLEAGGAVRRVTQSRCNAAIAHTGGAG
jgi:hypothetical protein